MALPVMGQQCRIGVKDETTEGTAVTVDELHELVGGDIGLQETEFHAAGITGTRSHWAARTRANTRRVSGSITLQPNAIEWSQWLPRILGATASGTSFALAETLKFFTLVVDKDNGTDGKVYTYNGCKINKAVISGEQGGAVTLQLDIEGWDEAIGNAGTFPSLTLNVATGPFMFSDSAGAITVAATAYPFKRFTLTVDNMLDTERFMNSTTRTALQAKDRVITLELEAPLGEGLATYPTAATLAAGVACVLTFTNTIHAVSMAITLPKVHFPRRSPVLGGREEVMIVLSGQARATSAGNELSIVLDSTA